MVTRHALDTQNQIQSNIAGITWTEQDKVLNKLQITTVPWIVTETIWRIKWVHWGHQLTFSVELKKLCVDLVKKSLCQKSFTINLSIFKRKQNSLRLVDITFYFVPCFLLHSRLKCLGGVPVLWSKWPLASSLLHAIKTCRQACPPGYLMHFS